MRQSKSRKLLLIIAICVLAGVLGVIFVLNGIVLRRGDSIETDFSEKGKYDCILVLGAGLRADGSPSDMLRDRLRGAVELYRQGVSERILLSGDCSGLSYDEVGAMEGYCLSEGIPQDALIRDDRGYSTYESVKNAKEDGRYGRIVIVTQEYHLYRALYLADHMGMEADGFAADYHTYRGQWARDAREIVARVKDFFMAAFSA